MSESKHVRLVVIEDSTITDITPEELRKGLSEEYLFRCEGDHYEFDNSKTKMDPKKVTVFHRKARPVG